MGAGSLSRLDAFSTLGTFRNVKSCASFLVSCLVGGYPGST